MITLSELFNEALVRSGAFMLKDNLEIKDNDENFKILVDATLRDYNKYKPLEKSIQIYVQDTFYSFVDPPRMISDVIPLRYFGSSNYLLNMELMGKTSNYSSIHPNVKENFYWRYEKPTLYVPYAGDYEIQSVYDRKILLDEANGNYYSDDLDDVGNSFYELLTGMLMITLGRSRRSFKMTDLPIEMDASEMVQGGKTLVEEASKSIKDGSKFYLAWS